MDTGEDKQLLTVSSPCLLLNHIAQRYTRTSRIIMEYVDNSLDDAEALYKENTKSYSRSINILVEINRQKETEENSQQLETKDKLNSMSGTQEKSEDTVAPKTVKVSKKKAPKQQEKWITEVTVTDNCRGMSNAILNRLIMNVGESSKRHSKFTNGHFGFGVHAFRACAKNIEFKTKASGTKTFGLKMDRDNEYFSKPKYVKHEGVQTPTGTIVRVSNFDNTWSEQLEPKEIIKEIQYHFSGLLERENLTIAVRNVVKDSKTICKPFLYQSMCVQKKIKRD